MRHVIVTGSTGLLGSEFARRLAADGLHKVTAFARSPLPFATGPNLSAMYNDDLFGADWATGIGPQTAIVHCAGLSNPRAEFSGLAEVMTDHVIPHLRMFERLLEQGWRGRLILPSSGGTIYGDPKELPIRETHPLNPKSLYGLQKLCLERGFEDLARRAGFELIVLRISNPYGSAMKKASQGVIPILIDAFRNGLKFSIFGDGTALRDYIHFDDLHAALRACLDIDLPEGVLTMNMGSGVGVSLNALMERLTFLLEKRLDCEYVQSRYDVSSNILCCELARRRLDWKPVVTLEQGLKQLTDLYHVDHH